MRRYNSTKREWGRNGSHSDAMGRAAALKPPAQLLKGNVRSRWVSMMRQTGRTFLEDGRSQHWETCNREMCTCKDEQEIGCFEGIRGRKQKGRETGEGEERKKADRGRKEIR